MINTMKNLIEDVAHAFALLALAFALFSIA